MNTFFGGGLKPPFQESDTLIKPPFDIDVPPEVAFGIAVFYVRVGDSLWRHKIGLDLSDGSGLDAQSVKQLICNQQVPS